jgi:hypothetical protein
MPFYISLFAIIQANVTYLICCARNVTTNLLLAIERSTLIEMSRKLSCDNTDYTNGFKISRDRDGNFIAAKGKIKLAAKTAKEINQLIKKQDKSSST